MFDHLDLRKTLPGLGAASIMLVALFSHGWWSGEGMGVSVHAGLRSLELCMAGTCESSAAPGLGSSFFRLASGLTLYGGVIAALLLLLDTVVRQLTDVAAAPRLSAHACSAVAMAAVLSVIAFPGVGDYGIGIGWAFWVFLVASLIGIYAGFASALGSDMGTGAYIRVELAGEGGGAEGDDDLLDLEGGAPVAIVQSRPGIRFVCKELRLDGKGVWVVSVTGGKRMVRFVDLASMCVRQFPAKPPYRGLLVLDMVPGGQGADPIRITEETPVELEGSDVTGDVRRVARTLLSKNPSLQVDEGSRGYVRDGRAVVLRNEDDVYALDSQCL